MKCRHCNHDLTLTFLDLGSAPPSNAYLSADALNQPEVWYPLKVLVCEACWLVQTEDHAGREALFTKEYAYFSSFSASWLLHAQDYVQKMIKRFSLTSDHCIVEIAANDGYLLQYVKHAGIPCYGIEPTNSTATAARQKGIDIIEQFFGTELAESLRKQAKLADLIVANNVLAHVPDINDFVAGFACLLTDQGIATFEFPHLLQQIDQCQFDTVYHEHYSYLSLIAVKTIFERNGLTVFDVEQLPTHGGSLRVFAQRQDTRPYPVSEAVAQVLADEKAYGLASSMPYLAFQAKAEQVKNALLHFLLQAKNEGKHVLAYGAAAKGNTLLNFAGVRPDLLPYVVDRNPAKQGQSMPGSRIPIVDEQQLKKDQPDYVLLLPWNLQNELVAQLDYIAQWGGRLMVAVPYLKIL